MEGKKWMYFTLSALGAAATAFLVMWWINDRRIPTLRISHTVGQGNDVSVEWIQLK